MEAYRFSMQSVRSWANQTLESEATKTLFGSFATFLGASPDDSGGAELGWLFASVLQNAGNNLVKGFSVIWGWILHARSQPLEDVPLDSL
jgi:phytoene dehydrogenase-like protein